MRLRINRRRIFIVQNFYFQNSNKRANESADACQSGERLDSTLIQL